jgi:adenylyltransferase/sulfurtransferase
LRCIFPETPSPGSLETCDVAGVSSPAVSVITGLQASLALDACLGTPADGFLHEISLSPFRSRSLDVSGMTDPSCPVCQLRQFPQLSTKIHSAPIVLCGQNAVQLPAIANAVPGVDSDDTQPSILNLAEIANRLERSVDIMTVQRSRFMCRGILHQSAAVRSISVFADGRTIVHGTEDPSVARALRARLLG